MVIKVTLELLLTTGPADIILCDSHFSWRRQKRPTSSDDITTDATKEVTRPWSLSDISLTILPVRELCSSVWIDCLLCFMAGTICWCYW